jgi:hypothetical protein
MIIVYGGCQADEPGRVTPRLPSDAADEVFGRIRGLLQSLAPTCVVGALASGADILFARAALEEGIPLKVLLPFDAETFRGSVTMTASSPRPANTKVPTKTESPSQMGASNQPTPMSTTSTTARCLTMQQPWRVQVVNGCGC